MTFLPPPGKAARLAFVLGGLLAAFGSITSLPHSWPGQVVLSVFAGALFVAAGSLRLALLLALRPGAADALLSGAAPEAGTFRDWPALRWALVASLSAAAIGAALVVAGDVHAWSTMRWAMPAGASWLVLG